MGTSPTDINKSGIAYARLLLQYFTKKDRAILAKLKIRAKEPKTAIYKLTPQDI